MTHANARFHRTYGVSGIRQSTARSGLALRDQARWLPDDGGARRKAGNLLPLHLEGVIAKRADSKYLPGKRTGLWVKIRFNMTQEFVIGGYTPSHLGLDAIIVGVYRGKDLYFSSRVRAGFTPVTRRQVFQKIHKLETDRCPFVNLPQPTAGRWGLGITAEAMKGMVWLRPESVTQIEFLEWTGGDILRSATFVRLREDKDPRKVVKET